MGELNTQLNRLAAVHSRDKAGVLRTLCMRSTARMMYWIVCIILKDLKVRYFDHNSTTRFDYNSTTRFDYSNTTPL